MRNNPQSIFDRTWILKKKMSIKKDEIWCDLRQREDTCADAELWFWRRRWTTTTGETSLFPQRLSIPIHLWSGLRVLAPSCCQPATLKGLSEDTSWTAWTTQRILPRWQLISTHHVFQFSHERHCWRSLHLTSHFRRSHESNTNSPSTDEHKRVDTLESERTLWEKRWEKKEKKNTVALETAVLRSTFT